MSFDMNGQTETSRRPNAGTRLLSWAYRKPMEAVLLFLCLLVGTPLMVGIAVGILIGVLIS